MSKIKVIRVEAVDADIKAYRALRKMLWPMSDDENHRETLQVLSASEKWAAFLARGDDEQPLGFVEVRLREFADGASSSPVGFLEGWYVTPEARRQGVGRILVESGERWARSKGCTEMASDTETERTGSIEAHKRLGYKELELHVCFLKKLT
jgi:aminoglycoside 6'-N-acetyltransferase I